jgi:hypothetical protein
MAMNQREYFQVAMIGIMSLVISFPIWASAEEVGSFTRVEQRVDYQKGETAPATPAKEKGPVEVRDVIRTYDLSRAQVQFRDKSTIIISPKSKVAIENYMFDPAKFDRSAKLSLAQGVMNVVVPAMQKGESAFIIKTSTAILGVRGTEFIVTSGTNFTAVYAVKDKVCIKSAGKEPSKDSTPRSAPGIPPGEEEVCLPPGTMSVVLPNQPPSAPQPISSKIMGQAQGLVISGIDDIPGSCVVGTLPGVNLMDVANNLISRGANVETVKASLGEVCYAGAETFTYSTPPPPAPPVGVGPTFPGGGGGGGGGQASSSSPQ